MGKRPATAVAADQNFIKAYFELKRLRADIEHIERTSGRRASQAPAAGRDASRRDGVREVLRS